MDKVGRKQKAQKVCRKHVKFTKSGRKFAKVGGKSKKVIRNFGG